MLSPRDRSLLLEALRPPAGYELDRAIGTSYSLDLLALLTVPLAFTFFDWESEDGRPTSDPVALLEALRTHADRIHLFCQADAIALPPGDQPLLAHLEPCVIPVRAPNEHGLFHPKVWVLRFVAGDDDRVRYRLICCSRNLTFDRSWDTIVCLDGELRGHRLRRNLPVVDFIAALPGMALRAMDGDALSALKQISEEMRRVAFDLPEGVESLAFHALGVGRPVDAAPPSRRPILIASPFIDPAALLDLMRSASRTTLISRPEALRELPVNVLERFSEVYYLDSSADPAADEGTGESELLGLHAKLYIIDDGWNAIVWTGSANATSAAWHRNVEFLVELRGKKSALGIERFMGSGDGSGDGMRDLLRAYRRDEDDREPEVDAAEKRLEEAIWRARRVISGTSMTLRVVSGEQLDRHELRVDLATTPEGLPEGITVRVRPVTLPASRALNWPPGAGQAMEWGGLSLLALTGFLGVEIEAREGGISRRSAFALSLPLDGAPEDRAQRLLAALLADSRQVLRLMRLLLESDQLTIEEFAQTGVGRGGPQRGQASAYLQDEALLEPLMKALGDDPRRLDAVARLLEDLERTEDGRSLLPAGIKAIWDPVWQVRQEGLE